MDTKNQKVIKALEELNILYEIQEHPAVFTIEEMENYHICDHGEVIKNLFLRDSKGKRHFLVLMQKDKQVNLKTLKNEIMSTPLSFASEERLNQYLGLEKGSVSPFGILNDKECAVEVICDHFFKDCPKVGIHPNVNTATVWISFTDLLKVIEHHGNPISFISI